MSNSHATTGHVTQGFFPRRGGQVRSTGGRRPPVILTDQEQYASAASRLVNPPKVQSCLTLRYKIGASAALQVYRVRIDGLKRPELSTRCGCAWVYADRPHADDLNEPLPDEAPCIKLGVRQRLVTLSSHMPYDHMHDSPGLS